MRPLLSIFLLLSMTKGQVPIKQQVDLTKNQPSSRRFFSDDKGNIFMRVNVWGHVGKPGSITVNDIRGDLDIEDGSGEVNVKDIAGAITIDDGSGSISVNGAGSLFIEESGSGGLDIKNVKGAVEIDE